LNEKFVNKKPQILVTGRLWLGVDGARSIGSEIIDLIGASKREIIIVAYRLTITVVDFIRALEAALDRGCYVRIIRNCSDQTISAEELYIEKLLIRYKNLSVWDFKENITKRKDLSLHAKMIIVDRKIAIVGSANFSRNGMIENHELAVRLAGDEVKSLGMACDKLLETGQKDGVLIRWQKR